METVENNTEVVEQTTPTPKPETEAPKEPRKIKIVVSPEHSQEELMTIAQAMAYAYANIPTSKLEQFNALMERKPNAIANLLEVLTKMQDQKEKKMKWYDEMAAMKDLLYEVSAIFN